MSSGDVWGAYCRNDGYVQADQIDPKHHAASNNPQPKAVKGNISFCMIGVNTLRQRRDGVPGGHGGWNKGWSGGHFIPYSSLVCERLLAP